MMCLNPGLGFVSYQEIWVKYQAQSENRGKGQDQTEEAAFFKAGTKLKNQLDR